MNQRSEDQQLAIDNLRRFLDQKIEPEFKAHGSGPVPRELMKDWTTQLAQFGLINAPHPAEYGGLGLGWQTHLMLYEEVVYTSSDIALPIVINTCAADLIMNLAPVALRERYLPGLLDGSVFASIAISEPAVGSDVAAVQTRARRDGDHWVITGEKTWITNGRYSDFLICTCRTDEGLTHILLDREEHPYEVRDVHKIALNGQSTTQIFLDDVRVPVENTIGRIGEGLRQTLTVFERARCHVGMTGVGLARRALDESIRYAQERSQHGKQIAAHQLIAEKIATMATGIDAARLLAMRAASMIDMGLRCDTECAMAKWYGTEMAVKVTRDAVQIHGGNGVTTEFPVERLAREALIFPIPDGTTEIQKLMIARALTGIPAFR